MADLPQGSGEGKRAPLARDRAAKTAGTSGRSVAQKVLPQFEAEARERQQQHGGTAPGRPKTLSPKVDSVMDRPAPIGKAAIQAAKAAGVSPGYVYDAKRLAEEAPDLFKKVEAGEISISTAKRHLQVQGQATISGTLDITPA